LDLKQIPFLILFDQNKENIEYVVDEFRRKIDDNTDKLNYNTQFIDFKEGGFNLINCGLNWLIDHMKPIL
jgi:hypothetical protein